jgi:hypothetical protein
LKRPIEKICKTNRISFWVTFVKYYIVELSVVAVVVSSLEKVTTITTLDESSGIAFFSMA